MPYSSGHVDSNPPPTYDSPAPIEETQEEFPYFQGLGGELHPPLLRFGQSGRKERRKVNEARDDFAFAFFRIQMKVLVEEARKLEKQSSANFKAAHYAFKRAQRSAAFGGLEVDGVLKELERRGQMGQTLTEEEIKFAYLTRVARQERDMDESVTQALLVLQELVEEPIVPGLTAEKLDACLQSLSDTLSALAKPFGNRPLLQCFPDGPQWKTFLEQFYVYSETGIINEVDRVDEAIDLMVEKQELGQVNGRIHEFIEQIFPNAGAKERVGVRFRLRRAVCEALRNTRLILEETGNSVSTRIAAIKFARRTIMRTIEEAARNEAQAEIRQRAVTRKLRTSSSKDHRHTPPSASLAYIPVPRYLVNNKSSPGTA
ncbi:hypothetical protein JCM3765_004317 [Sporobolomyces pararoseus]